MPSFRNHLLKDAGGALGDLGTLLPLSLGAIGLAGLATIPVLLGFGVFYVTTGLYFRLPIPIQPMRAITASAAHHRFGARTAIAPLLLGISLILVALVAGGLSFLTAIPTAGLGALLFVAAVELALTRRLRDAKSSCWPVIAITALVTVWTDPFLGFVAGLVAEATRVDWMRSGGMV
jgi:hypothetical protein